MKNKPTKEEIGRFIPFYLKDKQMTVKEFADKLNVNRVSVYRWIEGKPMYYNNYIVLLSVLREYY